MRLRFERIAALPVLSWCAALRAGSDEVLVVCGSSIETGEDYFVEGIWDGEFRQHEFLRSSTFMGSGGKVQGEKIVFATPCHTLERLYHLNANGRAYISNSLAFVLSQSCSELDTSYPYYHVDIMSVARGLRDCIKAIPLRNKSALLLHGHCNMEMDSSLQFREIPKLPPATRFDSYRSYREFLASSVRALTENARSEGRRVTYAPLATISTGYDSPACAVLAKEAGCVEAVSFKDAREGNGHDSGLEIGRILAMIVKEFDRTSYLRLAGMPEAEFVAVGDLGQDLVWGALESDFRGRAVFTGLHGDKIWDRLNRKVTRQIVRGDPGGCSLVEFRLRVGFIHVPIPFLGSLYHPEIHIISNSDEMKPWSISGVYDRPIPRRIAEEAGIERRLFGTRKRAVTVLLNRSNSLRKRMTAQSFRSFESYYRKHKHDRSLLLRFAGVVRFRIRLIARQLDRVLRRTRCPLTLSLMIPAKYGESVGKPSFLIYWGQHVIRARYATSRRPPAKETPGE